MNPIILPEAEADLAEALSYYDDESRELGDDFGAEILRAIEQLREFPEAWPVVSRRTRRCLTRRFRFGIYYEVCPPEIRIVAIASKYASESLATTKVKAMNAVYFSWATPRS